MTKDTDMKKDALSRRTVLGGAALVGVGAVSLMSTRAYAKTSQSEAKYQDKPQGSSKCSSCSQFVAPDGCNLVEGKVSAEGWCQLYTPKG